MSFLILPVNAQGFGMATEISEANLKTSANKTKTAFGVNVILEFLVNRPFKEYEQISQIHVKHTGRAAANNSFHSRLI